MRILIPNTAKNRNTILQMIVGEGAISKRCENTRHSKPNLGAPSDFSRENICTLYTYIYTDLMGCNFADCQIYKLREISPPPPPPLMPSHHKKNISEGGNMDTPQYCKLRNINVVHCIRETLTSYLNCSLLIYLQSLVFVPKSFYYCRESVKTFN
jgi:hypothetical protein